MKPHENRMKTSWKNRMELTCTLFRFLTPAQHHHTKRGQGTCPGRATLRDFAFTKHCVGGGTRATWTSNRNKAWVVIIRIIVVKHQRKPWKKICSDQFNTPSVFVYFDQYSKWHHEYHQHVSSRLHVPRTHCNKVCSSFVEFPTGVAVIPHRYRDTSALTHLYRFVRLFLISCTSSATTRCQST